MDFLRQHIPEILIAIDQILRLVLAIRVIMRRRPVGVSLAWLSVILIVPYAGAGLYLVFGELRLGRRRADWLSKIHMPFEIWLFKLRERAEPIHWQTLGPECEPLSKLVETTVNIPALPGNMWRLYSTTDEVFDEIVQDIDAARSTCHREFYIWNVGGRADDVADALIRAAARGVTCRVLVDAVGSRPFLKSKQAAKLKESGIALHAALPGGLIRGLFVRFDLRLHRKIIVIDGEIAYTGSMNLVDPRCFKQNAGVGEWIDAMTRIEGPAVEGLAVTFVEDWELETSEGVERLAKTSDIHPVSTRGAAVIQAIPSGPLVQNDAIQQILLMAIYSARDQIVLTTPYFVPDESILTALTTAVRRGVDVTLILPETVDSRLVALASQAHQGDLIRAGVHVMLFEGGLLHTKSITVDGQFSLFGSLNLDPRSLYLNFEITLAAYDVEFTAELRRLQATYISQSKPVSMEKRANRSSFRRLAENTARLLGPLL